MFVFLFSIYFVVLNAKYLEKLVRRQQLEVENKQRKFALIKTYLAKAMDHRTDTTRIKEKFQQMSENVTKKLR